MVVLITGCRSGIGLVTAAAIARAGHAVYAGLRDVETGAALAAACEGLDVTPLALDVTDPGQREAAVARILAERGRLDALVNNAGVGIGGFVEQLDEDEFRQVYDVNVVGAWGLTRAVLPAMRAQGEGIVVNISSMSGRMALAGNGLYSSSKFALEGLSEALRLELKPFGIRVVLVEPGAFRTDIMTRNRRVCRAALVADGPYAVMAARLDVLWRRTVERQARDPAEVGEKVLVLLTARRPRLRHPVGPDAWFRAFALRFLPRGLIEWVLGYALR